MHCGSAYCIYLATCQAAATHHKRLQIRDLLLQLLLPHGPQRPLCIPPLHIPLPHHLLAGPKPRLVRSAAAVTRSEDDIMRCK